MRITANYFFLPSFARIAASSSFFFFIRSFCAFEPSSSSESSPLPLFFFLLTTFFCALFEPSPAPLTGCARRRAIFEARSGVGAAVWMVCRGWEQRSGGGEQRSGGDDADHVVRAKTR